VGAEIFAGGRIIEGRIIVFNHFQIVSVSMLVLPFIMYGVTKPVTAVTKGVTVGWGWEF
jgi:hypothetical protein